MKIRIDGTEKEIEEFLNELSHSNFQREVRFVSKFYPDKQDYKLQVGEKTGRIYLEF